MSELVRVKLPSGAEATVGDSFAKSHDLKPLDKPAVDGAGRTIRTKYPRSLRTKASGSDAGEGKPNTSGGGSAKSKEDSK